MNKNNHNDDNPQNPPAVIFPEPGPPGQLIGFDEHMKAILMGENLSPFQPIPKYINNLVDRDDNQDPSVRPA